MDIPNVENEFLADFLVSLKKRRKAIRYGFDEVICQKVYDNFEDHREEKIELHLSQNWYEKSELFQFNFWEDRWVQSSAYCITKKGKIWSWSHRGRLFPVIEGRELVRIVESSYYLTPLDFEKENIEDYLNRVKTLWAPILGNGPVEVL